MARPKPQNPRALAAVIAAVRSYANDSPSDDFGRRAVEQLSAAGASKEAARRVVARFDQMNPSLRESALGEFANRPVEPLSEAERTTTRGGRGRFAAAEGVVFSHAGPRTGLTNGRLGEGVVREEVSTGHVPATYMLDYVGFHCESETGLDYIASDEVYAITSAVSIAPDGQNIIRTEKHPIDQVAYGDVDQGETRLGPVARCWQDNNLPLSLSVIAYERDYGDPNYFKDEIDAVVKAAVLVGIYLFGPGAAALAVLEALKPLISDAINWLLGTDDDQIDIVRTRVFEKAEIEEIGKHEPLPYTYGGSVNTNLVHHFLTVHEGDGAKYVFGFVFHRDPEFVHEVVIV